MKTLPLTIRGCRPEVHQALKKRAKAKHRSLSAEILSILEDAAAETPVTGREFAARLRKARKLMTEEEHRQFGEDIERGIKLMRREHLR